MNNQIQWDEAEVQRTRELALERAKAEASKANDRLLLYFTRPARVEMIDIEEGRN